MPALRGSLEPWLKDEIEYRPWQLDGIRKLATMPSFLCADEMGLGKSLEALTVFAIDVFMGLYDSGIIVCPPTLIGNWIAEIEKFTRIPYMVLTGPKKKRNQIILEFSLMKGPKLLITNYEKIDLHLNALNKLKFGAAIFDEAHAIKTHDSNRTQAVHALQNGRSMLLTGTPMLGHVNDLWGLLYKIDPNNVPNYWSFVNQFAVFGGYKGQTVIGTKNERKLRAMLEKYMVRRLAKDHLDIDTPFIVQRLVDLTDEQRKVYNRIKQDMKVARPDEPEEDIEHDIVVNTRLRQVCTNLMEFTGEDISPKLDLCMEDDEQLFDEGKKVVVFTQFRENVARYIERHNKKYNSKKTKIPAFQLTGDVPQARRQPTVNEWAAVKGPAVIVCMFQVANLGINNMQQVCHNMAMLDKLYVPGLNEQAIARLVRLGQTQPVTVREYKARGTVEDRVDAINKQKIKTAARVVEKPPWRQQLKDKLIEMGRIEEVAS